MLSSFRKLLLRKTDSDEMKQLIKNLSQESLAERVIESLEKMAHYRGASSSPNASLSDFTEKLKAQKNLMDGEEPGMVASIRDAMGHHASAYKKSLEQGRMSDATSHARKFVQYGNLAYKISRQAPDVMSFEAPALQPWQRNDQRFLQKDGKWNATGWKAHHDNGGDFSWLRSAPHTSYAKEIFKTPHKVEGEERYYHDGSYPMEHAKINGKHITLHDDAEPGKAHPMDHHPIMDVFHVRDKQHTDQHAAKYKEDLVNFENSHSFNDINDRILERAMNPEAGKEPGEPVHNPSVYTSRLSKEGGSESELPDSSSSVKQEEPSEPSLPESAPDKSGPAQKVKSIEDQLSAMSPEEIDALLARIKGRK
jgi:hypothetical protein